MADKDLGRVRGRFVDKVSKAVLKQLLDDLLQDGLLNDGEKDSVLEDHTGKADMARALVDMVKKKGDRASRKMIAHLKDRDPTLYSELGLSCGRPAQPTEPSWSTKLVSTTDSFWREKVNDKNVYPVSEHSIKSRVALLITNKSFLNENMNRYGAEKDEENMEKLLASLDYEVVKHRDLTGKGMDDALIQFSKHPKVRQTDSVFVVIMSHGKLGAVLGVNFKEEQPDEFPIDNIYKHLGTKECPALLNKPKIIIIQACRGEQLQAIRREFVANVSTAVISQLLDDVLEDRILNDGEKDSILKKNCSTADRARSLIDTVKRKGDEASKKMIAHLQQRDPTLYSKLALSCAGAPAKEKQKEKEDNTYHNDDIYPVTKANIKNRVALLITNIKFANVKLNRNGADIDEKNMEKLLSSLGYEVVKHTNLTGKQMDDAVLKFSKHPKLEETDSVWVVMMSHGKLGNVLGVNWNEGDAEPDQFRIDNIYKYLDSEHCLALLNKPKVVVIQACRGDEKGHVLVSDGSAAAGEAPQSCPSGFEDDAIRRVHKEKDFISLLSCTPDTVSYRQPDRGSLLIQFIVKIFEPSAQSDHIEELFRKVMRHFEDLHLGGIKQMATKDRCTLTKHFYVVPRP